MTKTRRNPINCLVVMMALAIRVRSLLCDELNVRQQHPVVWTLVSYFVCAVGWVVKLDWISYERNAIESNKVLFFVLFFENRKIIPSILKQSKQVE